MVKVFVDFRRRKDGGDCTIEHHVSNERDARNWSAKMAHLLEKSGDEVKSVRMLFVKETQKEEEEEDQ